MTGGLILLRRQMRAAATKDIVDLGMRRQKTLSVARRFVSPHLAFPLPGGLMGNLRPIVQSLVLPMLDAGQDVRLGGSIALQFVCHQHARDVA